MPIEPFHDFKLIPTVSEILETAYNRANKKADAISGKSGAVKLAKAKEIKRIDVAFEYVMEYLDDIVKSVPDLQQLPPFYQDLAQILVDNDQLKQKLGRISGNIRVIEKLKHEKVREVISTAAPEQIGLVRKQAFGRMQSVIQRLEPDFAYLREARKKLKSLPVVNSNVPSVVIAGYPNVGKSSVINNLCGSKLQVAVYPFTTKRIKVGLYKRGNDMIQFIDTPGVLDRPMPDRNAIELQAITAMKYIANVIVFIIDPSQNSGFDLADQLNLLQEVKGLFPDSPIVIMFNKIDVSSPEERQTAIDRLHELGEEVQVEYSAMTRDNEDALIAAIKDRIKDFYLKKSD
jgi:nucleolar GTP-binding protein